MRLALACDCCDVVAVKVLVKHEVRAFRLMATFVPLRTREGRSIRAVERYIVHLISYLNISDYM